MSFTCSTGENIHIQHAIQHITNVSLSHFTIIFLFKLDVVSKILCMHVIVCVCVCVYFFKWEVNKLYVISVVRASYHHSDSIQNKERKLSEVVNTNANDE